MSDVSDPMSDISDPLAKFLSGRRQSERQRCHVPVTLWSGRRRFQATILDLSVNGALINLAEDVLHVAVGGRRVGSHLDVVDRNFGGGFEVEFPGGGPHTPAEVVRIILMGGEDSAMRIGCKFPAPLREQAVEHLVTVYPPEDAPA